MTSRRDFFGSLLSSGVGLAGWAAPAPAAFFAKQERPDAGGNGALGKALAGHFDVTDFGAVGDGTTDDTSAVQEAIRAAEESEVGRVLFPRRGPWRVGSLEIGRELEMEGRNAVLRADASVVLSVTAPLDYLRLSGLSFTFPQAEGRQGREAFRNHQTVSWSDAASTHYGTEILERHSIRRLLIEDCAFSLGKVTVTGSDTVCWIRRCRWRNASPTVTTAPYYFAFVPNAEAESDTRCFFTENHLSVRAPSGHNQDIIKITGRARHVIVAHNYVENLNPESEAQIDLFTGAAGARVIGNTLVNTQFLRKQTGTVSVDVSHDIYAFNHVRLGPGHLTTDAFILRGTLWKAIGNDINLGNPDAPGTAFFLDNEENAKFDAFATDMPTAFQVCQNSCDARSAHPGSRFIWYEGDGGRGGLGVVSGNLFLGGGRFIGGTPPHSSVVGNVWGSSEGAVGLSVNTGPGSIVVGNTVDSESALAKETGTDRISRSPNQLEVGSSRPDVSRGGLYVTDNTRRTRITGLDGGRAGQRVTILVKDRFTRFIHDSESGNLRLRNRQDAVPARGDVLELIYDGELWYQINT